MTTLYYLQDSRQVVGNSMLWWREGGGYTCDLEKAEVFTKENLGLSRSSDIAWPKDYIDAKTSRHADMQRVRDSDTETLRLPPPPKVKAVREPPHQCSECGQFMSSEKYHADKCDTCTPDYYGGVSYRMELLTPQEKDF